MTRAEYTNFPVGTWHEVTTVNRENGREYRAWFLGNKKAAVHFWFEPYIVAGFGGDIMAGIETHRFCAEDDKALSCRHSPTGFCHPDGTSLGGNHLYEEWRACGSNDSVIWDKLKVWLEDVCADLDRED